VDLGILLLGAGAFTDGELARMRDDDALMGERHVEPRDERKKLCLRGAE